MGDGEDTNVEGGVVKEDVLLFFLGSAVMAEIFHKERKETPCREVQARCTRLLMLLLSGRYEYCFCVISHRANNSNTRERPYIPYIIVFTRDSAHAS